MFIDYDNTLTLNVHVTDWEASKAFYRDILGMTMDFEVPEVGWAEFSWGVTGTTIGLNRVDAVSPTDAITLTIRVTDIAAARKTLESRGVVFEGDIDEVPEMVRLSFFADPDGNKLCLAQSLMR